MQNYWNNEMQKFIDEYQDVLIERYIEQLEYSDIPEFGMIEDDRLEEAMDDYCSGLTISDIPDEFIIEFYEENKDDN